MKLQAAVFRAVAAEKWNADKAIAEQRLETALKLSQDSTERKGTAFEQEAVRSRALCLVLLVRAWGTVSLAGGSALLLHRRQLAEHEGHSQGLDEVAGGKELRGLGYSA